MNALMERNQKLAPLGDTCHAISQEMLDCLPYTEMLLAVARRMTGNGKAARLLLSATISAYLNPSPDAAPMPPSHSVKFRLLSLLRNQYQLGAHMARPGS